MPYIYRIRKCKADDICKEKLTPSKLQKLAKKMNTELKSRGIQCVAEPDADHINMRGCVLTKPYLKRYGHNRSKTTLYMMQHWNKDRPELKDQQPRRLSHLGWQDWVEFNDAINTVLDREGISANAKSLHGKFIIRQGRQPMREDDWYELAQENLFGNSSMMPYVMREEGYYSTGRGREGWRKDRQRRTEKVREKKEKMLREKREKYAGFSERVPQAHKKLYGEY